MRPLERFELEYLEELKKQSVEDKIECMELKITELERYILSSKLSLIEYCKELLNSNWFYRETGEAVNIYADLDTDFEYSISWLKIEISKIKTLKQKISIEYDFWDNVKNMFTNPNSLFTRTD